MNGIEFCTLLIAIAGVAVFLKWKRVGWLTAAACAMACVPAFFIAVEMASQYMMIDETYILLEPLNLATSGLGQWGLGALRTTDVILGTMMHLLKYAVPLEQSTGMMVLKMLHWLLGLVLLIVIFEALWNYRYGENRSNPWFLVFFLHCSLLFPVVAGSMKTFNYDLYSMLFSVLAVIWLLRGWRDGSVWFMKLAVVAAACAAQEKLIATPFLWLTIIMYVAKSITAVAYNRRQMRDALTAAVRGLALALAVILGSYLIVVAVRGGRIPTDHYNDNPVKILAPLWTGMYPIIRLILGDSNIVRLRTIVPGLNRALLLLGAGFAVSMVLCFCAVAGYALQWLSRASDHVWWQRLKRLLPLVNLVLLVGVIIGGILATFLVRQYWSPPIVIPPGMYDPKLSFNNFTIHHGASTLVGHLFLCVAYAYAVFVNALPVTAMAVLAAVYFITWRQATTGRQHPALRLLCVGLCLLAPCIYGVTQTPVANRYFNLFLFTVLAFALIDLYRQTRGMRRVFRMVVFCVTALFVLLEAVPFRPLLNLFRPFWSRYPEHIMSSPVDGINTPWGVGGGEELFLAGRKIYETRTPAEENPLRIYYFFYRGWIGAPAGLEFHDLSDSRTHRRFTTNDYYIYNRLASTQGWAPLPRGLEPDITVRTNGFTHAWVFRGDRLAQLGWTP